MTTPSQTDLSISPRLPLRLLPRLFATALVLAAPATASLPAGDEPVDETAVAAEDGNAQQAPDLVATWNGGSLVRGDFESYLDYRDFEPSPEALFELIYVTTYAEISRNRGEHRRPAVQFELAAMRQQVLVPLLRDRILAEVEVSDEEVEKLRRDNPQAFVRPRKLKLSNIYKRLEPPAGERLEVEAEAPDDSARQPPATPTDAPTDAPAKATADSEAVEARMEELRRKLLEGADFEELARQESESQTRFRGGAVGWVNPEELPAAVAKAVRGLEPGELSEVVEHGGGVSIFRCEEVREIRKPSPEEVREKIRNKLWRQRTEKRWQSFQHRLLAEAELRLDPTGTETVLEVTGYRLDAEQAARLLAERFPESHAELTPEARGRFLETWAGNVLAVRHAEQLGLHLEKEAAAALRFREIEILARQELVRRVDEAFEEPTDDEVRKSFDPRGRGYRQLPAFEVAAIFFGGEDAGVVEEARRVLRDVDEGELTFAEAARRHSKHRSAEDGGLVGWRNSGQLGALGPLVTTAVKQLEPGEHTGLLHLESGVWAIQLRDRREGRILTFEEAKAKARADLVEEKREELTQRLRQEHLESLDIEILDETLQPQPTQ